MRDQLEDGRLSRREVLGLAAAAGVSAVSAGLLRPGGAHAAAGPIVKPLPPEWFIPYGSNAEMRWDAVAELGHVIPNERFFVRNHTRTPAVDPATYRLEVFGDAVRGRSFSYDELTGLPARTLTAAIECAGNGRSFFGSQQGTPVAGTPWKLGGIGVARWRGVPLAEVLERAGLGRHAVDVMPQGLDDTVVTNGANAGHVRRPLPIAKALDDVLLAYEMNGRELPLDHGFPVRLVVPGWVGIASIKWVGSIEVAGHPLGSPWSTTSYRMTGPSYPPDAPALTTQPVKSAFELAFGAELQAGRRHLLTGRSWSGRAPIRHVEVSTDGGATWRRARPAGHHAGGWLHWELPWRPRSAGSATLIARATDRAGATQPRTVPFNDGGYQFWAQVRHPVTVT